MRKQYIKAVSVAFFLIVAFTGYAVRPVTKAGPVTPATAMQSYLNNNDTSYFWTLKDTVKGDGITVYMLELTSQKWRKYLWKHNLTIAVPDELTKNEALLYISGGKIKEDGEPYLREGDKRRMLELSPLAKKNKAIAAMLWQVPNQPLYDGLTEDALISYTLHNYLNDGDLTWPLLFPMTKSAVKAMDAVQEFAKKKLDYPVDGFVVTGFSKRGWTTWLTGANDKRVRAIAPMVIDILNMPVNVDYQLKAWGDYSIEIRDYVNLGIAQQVGTEKGKQIVHMIDPYSYRKTLTMPKMIFIGTNDPYWPADAVKNYFDSIPGENYIHYVPNVEHDLGDRIDAFGALSAFWENTMQRQKYPACTWKFKKTDKGITLSVSTSPEMLEDVWLWTSVSDDRDFRDNEFKGKSLGKSNASTVSVDIPMPDSGFKASYIDLKYRTKEGQVFTESTRMFVFTDQGLTDWTDLHK